jgi:hypothetical protein
MDEIVRNFSTDPIVLEEVLITDLNIESTPSIKYLNSGNGDWETDRHNVDFNKLTLENDIVIFDISGEAHTYELPSYEHQYFTYEYSWDSNYVKDDKLAKKVRWFTSDLYEREYRVKTHQYCWFEHAVKTSFRPEQRDFYNSKEFDNIDKHFIFMNNRKSPARVYLLSLLEKYNLVNKSYIGFDISKKVIDNYLEFGMNHPNSIIGLRYDYDYKIDKLYNDYITKVDVENTITGLLKENNYYLDRSKSKDGYIESVADSGNPWEYNVGISKFFNSSFLYICSESCIAEDKLFLTEKTFKGFLSMRPMIIIGNSFTLKKLREMGYKTFDKWIDESYDEIVDVNERISKISEILIDLGEKSIDELKDMLNDMREVLKHNYDNLLKRNSKNAKENLIKEVREFIQK